MIITFRSRAAGDVIMFGDVAKRMLEIMGKDPEEPKGILTVAQLPQAIASLQQAIADDKARMAAMAEEDRPKTEPAPGGGKRPFVSLAQRAAPLLEQLNYSLKEEQPVTWGT